MATDTLPEMGFFNKHCSKITFGGPDECWLWTAGADNRGYGQVKVRGNQRGAHREAYEATNGPGSAGGLVVRHKCDVPRCVNPAHLEIGTHADNSRDRDERGRTAKGEAVATAKLTDADVLAIRSAYVFGSRTHGLPALGRLFGVHHSQISKVVNRERWTHIE
jgi:hypothetical protein